MVWVWPLRSFSPDSSPAPAWLLNHVPRFWSTSRHVDSTVSLGSLCQSLMTLTAKKCLQISNLSLPWHWDTCFAALVRTSSQLLLWLSHVLLSSSCPGFLLTFQLFEEGSVDWKVRKASHKQVKASLQNVFAAFLPQRVLLKVFSMAVKLSSSPLASTLPSALVIDVSAVMQ